MKTGSELDYSVYENKVDSKRPKYWLLFALFGGLVAGISLAIHIGLSPVSSEVAPNVPEPFVALHKHFSDKGIITRVSLMNKMSRTNVRATALYTIRSGDKSFVVMLCNSNEHAQARLNEAPGATVNGPFVLYTTDWTEKEKVDVLETFSSFDTHNSLDTSVSQ